MLKKIRWYVKPFQYNTWRMNRHTDRRTELLICYINIHGFLKDFLEMHNLCLSHQPPRTWAVTRLHKVFKKDGGVEQWSSLNTGSARDHKIVLVITAVHFQQFSLYRIGTMSVQETLSWLPVSFSLHVKYTGIASYVVSYRSNSVCPPVRHVPVF